jgi:hypothetical protein
MLILRTYAYLRDAESKAFYHESMTEGLWDRVALLTERVRDDTVPKKDPVPPVPQKEKEPPAPKKEGTPKCSHCRSAAVHKQLKLEPTRVVCPFLSLGQPEARKAAGAATASFKDKEGTFPECCQVALESFL